MIRIPTKIRFLDIKNIVEAAEKLQDAGKDEDTIKILKDLAHEILEIEIEKDK